MKIRTVLMPLFALALLFSVFAVSGDTGRESILKESKSNVELMAELPIKLNLESKEAYKIDDAEYKTAVVSKTSLSGSVGYNYAGVGLIGIFTLIAALFRSKKEVVIAISILAISAIAFTFSEPEAGLLTANAVPAIMIKRITDLKADVTAKEARMKAIMDGGVQANRSRTAEESTEWTNLKNDLVTIRQEITDLEEQDRINRAQATTVEVPNVITEKKDLSGFSIMRGLRLMYEGKDLDGAEKEVHQIAVEEARANGIAIQGFAVPAFVPKEKRGQTVTGQTSATGDQGGLAVATEINSLIEALWEKNFLSEVGATRLAGLVGNQKFLVESTKVTAQEKTEIAELTDDEVLFDDIDMSPNRRGVSVPVSKQSIIQMSIDVQNLVMNSIRKALNKKLNQDAYTALAAAIVSGNGNLLALGASGAVAEWPDFVQLETIVANNNAEKVGMKYLTNTKVRGKAKTTQKFSTTNGDPIWEKGNEVNGYPAVVSNIIPSNLTKGASAGICSAILFGNFEDLYVGMWGGMDFVIDPYTLKKKHSIEITANMFWDVEIARALSFAGIKDALTA
jgi:hypothetical protein